MLAKAELIVASCLTLVESDRALTRATVLGLMPETEAEDRRAELARASQPWIVFDVDAAVLDRARRPFPREPIRTLDAIHLATGTMARALVPDLAFLTLDGRVRGSAHHLGFEVLPSD